MDKRITRPPSGYYVQRKAERLFFWERSRAENWIASTHSADATIHKVYSEEDVISILNEMEAQHGQLNEEIS